MTQNRNLSESIADRIKKNIITGEYPIGSRLPNEQELSEAMNVSRTTTREAVKLLVSRHILEIERGRGTFVTALPGISEDPFGLDFIPDERLVPDLFEMRKILEPEICYLAALRASPRQISDMKQITAKMAATTGTAIEKPYNSILVDSFTNLELEFHTLLYKMTHNVIFERMSPVVSRSVAISCTSNIYREGFDFIQTAEIHVRLYKAIKARDCELARQLGVEHAEDFLRMF